MRIVLVPNSYLPQLGGLEVAVSSVARELSRAGHAVTVIACSTSSAFSREVEESGVVVYRMPFFLPRLVTAAGPRRLAGSLVRSALFPLVFPLALWRFVRIVAADAPDVVNLHYLAENALFCLIARLFVRFRFVVSLHGSDVERYPRRGALPGWLARTTLRRADAVLANSRDLLEKAVAIEASVSAKSGVVANGIYPEVFSGAAGGREGGRYVLCVANFADNKGQDILVRAFALLRDREARLVLAGEGRTLDRCRDLAASLGVAGRVAFLGRVEHSDVPALMAGCAVCAIPSRKEAFGIVALEAMACGKPVVATAVGGVQDIVVHDETGLVVEPESPAAMAEALDRLLGDAATARELGENGFRRLLDNYTWPPVIDRYLATYADARTPEEDSGGTVAP